MHGPNLEEDIISIRNLRPEDLQPVIDLDAKVSGRRREEYFKVKLKQALSDTGIMISLAAEYEKRFAGFLLARVFYGEFGTTEQVAVLDTIGVHPWASGHGIGKALLRQLKVHLKALGIQKMQTEVAWENISLLSFFHREGFHPATRICLDLEI